MHRTGIMTVYGVVLLMAASCGRSADLGETLINVDVGVASLSGGPLTEERVADALEALDFFLMDFGAQPQCGGGQGCLWPAEGLVPRARMRALKQYQDPIMRVVYAEQRPAPEREETAHSLVPRHR